jgi:hypothetical protein
MSSMPTVKVWADELRAVFGAAEFNAGLKHFGYLASEGGQTIDTRKFKGEVGVTVDQMVIGPAPVVGKVNRDR